MFSNVKELRSCGHRNGRIGGDVDEGRDEEEQEQKGGKIL